MGLLLNYKNWTVSFYAFHMVKQGGTDIVWWTPGNEGLAGPGCGVELEERVL